MDFWRNPELVRYVRAELRVPRAITAAMLVLVVCVLLALVIWAIPSNPLRQRFCILYAVVLGIQFVAVGFGCASACGQSISRERMLKTHDFLRTTRLTSGELLLGKLLGAPIMVYFALACSLPISVAAGIAGGFSLGVVAVTYLLLLAFSLFLGLIGLLESMFAEKPKGFAAGLIALFVIYAGSGLAAGPLPGLGAISVYPSLASLYGLDVWHGSTAPTLFGFQVSFALLSFVLYAAFGAWLVLMISRNLKRDLEEIRLLSRWQAIGLAAFLNVVFYALLSTRLQPFEIALMAVLLNGVILFGIGLATLTPHEKLKVWWRRWRAGEQRYVSENGLAWPWLVVAAIVGYALLLGKAVFLGGPHPVVRWELGLSAARLLVFLLFAARDVLFIQWCRLTRMKHAVVKGFLYLLLYYTASTIIAATLPGAWDVKVGVLSVLTPYGAFEIGKYSGGPSSPPYVGIVLQVVAIGCLLRAIARRLSRPATLPAASPA